MLYIVPGILAGIVFYLFLSVVSVFVNDIWPKSRQLRAHGRLAIQCLAAIAFTRISQNWLNQRVRVARLRPTSRACCVSEVELSSHRINSWNRPACMASSLDWVKEAPQPVLQRQRWVPLDVVPFFFIGPWHTGHCGCDDGIYLSLRRNWR